MRIKKCLFPAAGYGTHFLPAPKVTPKVIAYKFDGQRFDYGSVDGFVGANNYFYNASNAQ